MAASQQTTLSRPPMWNSSNERAGRNAKIPGVGWASFNTKIINGTGYAIDVVDANGRYELPSSANGSVSGEIEIVFTLDVSEESFTGAQGVQSSRRQSEMGTPWYAQCYEYMRGLFDNTTRRRSSTTQLFSERQIRAVVKITIEELIEAKSIFHIESGLIFSINQHDERIVHPNSEEGLAQQKLASYFPDPENDMPSYSVEFVNPPNNVQPKYYNIAEMPFQVKVTRDPSREAGIYVHTHGGMDADGTTIKHRTTTHAYTTASYEQLGLYETAEDARLYGNGKERARRKEHENILLQGVGIFLRILTDHHKQIGVIVGTVLKFIGDLITGLGNKKPA